MEIRYSVQKNISESEVLPIANMVDSVVLSHVSSFKDIVEINDFIILEKLEEQRLFSILQEKIPPKLRKLIYIGNVIHLCYSKPDDSLYYCQFAIKPQPHHTIVYYRIFGESLSGAKTFEKFIKDSLSSVALKSDNCYGQIKWWYEIKDGEVDYTYITELFDDILYNQAYPGIEPNIESFAESYISSPEPILLLVGPPGTGKTRLIRYIIKKMLMRYAKQIDLRGDDILGDYESRYHSISYTTDAKIMNSSEIYIDLFRRDVIGLVLEDIDQYLIDREKSDNPIMHKILGAASGLVTRFEKKIFLSTNLRYKNLNDINNVDPALLRPGRCFAIIETRHLTGWESLRFLSAYFEDNKISTEPLQKDIHFNQEYSLAQLYRYIYSSNVQNNVIKPTKVGF